MTIRNRWNQTAVHNKAAVLTGALVAAGTVFYAFAAACQVHIMKQASVDSAAQVERLTGATNAAIKSAVDADSKSIIDTTAKNIDELKSTLAENRAALFSSERQSKAALDASIDNSHLDQRPWIGIGNFTEKPAATNGTVEITLFIRNSGRTPAVKMSGVTMQVARKIDEVAGDFDSEVARINAEFEAFNKGRRQAFDSEMAREIAQEPGNADEIRARFAIDTGRMPLIENKLFPDGGVMAPGIELPHIIKTIGANTAQNGRQSPTVAYILGKMGIRLTQVTPIYRIVG